MDDGGSDAASATLLRLWSFEVSNVTGADWRVGLGSWWSGARIAKTSVFPSASSFASIGDHASDRCPASSLAINQAMLDGKNNNDVQKLVREVQRKEIKLVVGKLACRDNAKKILTPEQWSKLIALYQAQP